MTIDWLNFAPWTALAGGLLIGTACAILILFNGKIAGVSGVVGGVVERSVGSLVGGLGTLRGSIDSGRRGSIGGVVRSAVGDSVGGVAGDSVGGAVGDRLGSALPGRRPSARGDLGWRLAFVGGLAIAPLVYVLAAPLPASTIEADNTVLIVAGLLVGLGTRYGAGCTSGHGVCGLSRRSPRSMAATASFMLAGFVTVYLVRHVLT